MVFNVGASTGGTDIVAMILHKYTSLEIGRALLVSDLGIVLIAAYLYGAQTGLYCILGMILKCTVVDSAIESLNLRKSLYHYQQVPRSGGRLYYQRSSPFCN